MAGRPAPGSFLREAHVGALMITDVSGFTRLTAKLSRESGQVGAERIGPVLNGSISRPRRHGRAAWRCDTGLRGRPADGGLEVSFGAGSAGFSSLEKLPLCLVLTARNRSNARRRRAAHLALGYRGRGINLVHLLSHSGIRASS